jgi:serine phosphatase RsbU (regulator of sigma subunit)
MFNNISIKVKLVLLLSFSAAMALFIALLASAYTTAVSERDEYVRSLQQLANITSENVQAALTFDDDISATKMLSYLKVNENIQEASLFNASNEHFASYSVQTSTPKRCESMHITWNKIVVQVPVKLDEQVIGTLQIISGTNHLKENIVDQILMQLFIILMTLIFVVLLTFLLQRVFTKPIMELLQAMRRVSKETNYEIVLTRHEQDEFQELYHGFNQMMREIKERDTTLAHAKAEIEAIHKSTQESIEYASLIQHALVPSDETMNSYFDEFFAIWQPRDVIGGDIYLFEGLRNEDEALLMVIDCTGHGVPGAFVTMLVKAIEREVIAKIVSSNEAVSPAKILAYFNKTIKNTLKQNSMDAVSNAGFDGGVVYYNRSKNEIIFAGAQTELFYIQEGEIKMIKGDKLSIGYKKSNPDYAFNNHNLSVEKGMKFYLTTDGYFDQTGGDKGFMFGKRRFKTLILELQDLSFDEQKRELEKRFSAYRGENETKDDVTVVGFKL